MNSESSDASRQQLRYTPLEAISVGRPVGRIKYIARACAGRYVLDLGAMDETAWANKRSRGTWLHEEIARVARQVEGVDNSRIIPAGGMATAQNALIRPGDIEDLTRLITELDEVPDTIVAGELIEHLENPLRFLRRFTEIPRLSGSQLILSTPNATALHNFLIGLARRESTHQDHLCILSYKTLTTLCRRAGFSNWQIIPYYSRFTEMVERHSGLARVAVLVVERVINSLEWLFPLLSFGYIVRIRL
ncbi:MAG TPA: methyltransferase domain-containing protein [Steroidobacteraceae bacterium]|nr:methyltransferase domain-containing protein [Steroidobacteraceae bacterium]